MSDRLIHPRNDVERALYRTEGWRSQRDLEDRDEALGRYPSDAQRLIIIPETLIWYRANVGNSGNSAAGYIMRVGGQSSDTAWASFTLPLTTLGQGRIIAARMAGSVACTAGLARLALNIIDDGVTDLHEMDDIEIDTTNTRQAAARWDWSIAKQFSADATIEARVVTESSFAGASAINITAAITFGYETWV